jgi:predicted DNA-binding protein (MmcQ/YjbR family)
LLANFAATMSLTIEDLRRHALSRPGVITESEPFGPETLVFKVGGKMFLLADIDSFPLQFDVKCDPERAIELRERYEAIQPGYHQNKRHWNTIIIDGSIPDREILSMIDHSFELVAPKPKRRA